MAGFVEYIVKIRDLGSAQVRQFANNTEGAFSRVTNRMSRMGSSVDQLNARIDQLTRTRNISLDSRQVERANREIATLEGRVDRLTNGSRNRGGLGLIGKGLLLGGLGAATALGGKMVNAGIERSMAGASFNVMGGEKEGGKLHKNLIGFASDTIYGNEVFGEAKTMLAFGVQAKNIMPAMRMLGDVAMGDAEHMKSLSLVFAQSAAAGKLMGQDVLQYVNAGFNPLQAMSQKTGRSMADLRKDMEKGKITFQDVVGAFEYATGPMGRFYQGMKKMGETPAGKWVAFKGLLETTAGTIGTQLLPALGGVATFVTGLIGQPQLLTDIAWGIGAMGLAWGAYTLYVQRAAIWTGILEAAAMWPLAVVGLLGYAYGDLKKLNGDLADSTEGTFARIQHWGDVIRRTFEDVIYVIQSAMLGVKSVGEHFEKIWGATSGKQLWEALKYGDTDADKKLNQLRVEHTWNRAMDMAGMDKDGKKKTPAADWMTSKFDTKGMAGGAGGGGVPNGAEDTAKGIAGGGVRNLTINIAKMGVDEVTMHVTNVRQGAKELEQIFNEMFSRVVNPGSAIVGNN